VCLRAAGSSAIAATSSPKERDGEGYLISCPHSCTNNVKETENGLCLTQWIPWCASQRRVCSADALIWTASVIVFSHQTRPIYRRRSKYSPDSSVLGIGVLLEFMQGCVPCCTGELEDCLPPPHLLGTEKRICAVRQRTGWNAPVNKHGRLTRQWVSAGNAKDNLI